MTNKILRLAIAPPQKRGKWIFKISIANMTNIMILATDDKGNFMVRFYTTPENAKEWIEGVTIGKYLD